MLGGFEFLIVLIPVAVWMYLKSMQNKKINHAVSVLEASGRVHFGQDVVGKPSLMVLVAVAKDGEIKDAQIIRMVKLVKPSSSFLFPKVIGKNINDSNLPKVTEDPALREALKNLKLNYSKDVKGEDKRNIKRVSSKRVTTLKK